MATPSLRPDLIKMIPETSHFVAATLRLIQCKNSFENEASLMKETRPLPENLKGLSMIRSLFSSAVVVGSATS